MKKQIAAIIIALTMVMCHKSNTQPQTPPSQTQTSNTVAATNKVTDTTRHDTTRHDEKNLRGQLQPRRLPSPRRRVLRLSPSPAPKGIEARKAKEASHRASLRLPQHRPRQRPRKGQARPRNLHSQPRPRPRVGPDARAASIPRPRRSASAGGSQARRQIARWARCSTTSRQLQASAA